MSNILIVTIDNSTQPPSLDIDVEGTSNEFGGQSNWQTIRWKLVGQAARGSFNKQGGKKPGFAWVGVKKPPEGIFSGPVLRHGGKVMSIAVLNDHDSDAGRGRGSLNTRGEWTYQLSVTIGEVTYQSIPPRATTTPRIKNT